MLRDPTVVFLDTETTGLDRQAEIIDIGIVDVHGRVLMDTLVRPRRAIPADASAIHGIFDRHVAGAPCWEEVYAHVATVLRGRRVVVYNAAFDRRLVEQCCAMVGLEVVACAWQCSMRRYAEYAGERTGWGRGYRTHKLERAAAAFGIPPGGHRARADADVCRQVVHGMALG